MPKETGQPRLRIDVTSRAASWDYGRKTWARVETYSRTATYANKTSVHSTQRVGIIKLAEQPEFTTHARRLLYDPHTRDSFRAAYGDYFLAGLCLGADNATFLSSSSGKNVQSEMKDIKVQAKFFSFTKTVYDKRTEEHSDNRSFDITYSGLDTLRAYQETTRATDERAYEGVKARAAQSVADGQGLMERVRGVMDEMHLVDRATLTSNQLTEVCRSGLVVDVEEMGGPVVDRVVSRSCRKGRRVVQCIPGSRKRAEIGPKPEGDERSKSHFHIELLLMPYGGLKEYAEITARFVPSVPSVRYM
ncbi:hypothetical protein B0H14DRAFT_3427540 [Mycena olivaceomarginata]|nr:hypothetical protein B0H14DRAFT_3427540 [Mycena olivaceomarginata]